MSRAELMCVARLVRMNILIPDWNAITTEFGCVVGEEGKQEAPF